MIKYDDQTLAVILDWADLERCGFDHARFISEIRHAGIGDPKAYWPIALLVNFAGGVTVTPGPKGDERALQGVAADRAAFERIANVTLRVNRNAAGQQEFFVITRLSRADIEARGFDASSLSDADVERFAEKMGDGYTGDGPFWDQIDVIAQEEFGLTREGECAWRGQPVDPKVAHQCGQCGSLLCKACAEGECPLCATGARPLEDVDDKGDPAACDSDESQIVLN